MNVKQRPNMLRKTIRRSSNRLSGSYVVRDVSTGKLTKRVDQTIDGAVRDYQEALRRLEKS